MEDVLCEKIPRMTGFCGRRQRLKFAPPAVYYHLNFSVSLFVFIFLFFQDTRVCEFTEKPGTIYCVTFRPRFFNTDTPFALFTLYRCYTYRRFLSLNLWELLYSRVSRSFQFRKCLQMSRGRHRWQNLQYFHLARVPSSKYSHRITLSHSKYRYLFSVHIIILSPLYLDDTRLDIYGAFYYDQVLNEVHII